MMTVLGIHIQPVVNEGLWLRWPSGCATATSPKEAKQDFRVAIRFLRKQHAAAQRSAD